MKNNWNSNINRILIMLKFVKSNQDEIVFFRNFSLSKLFFNSDILSRQKHPFFKFKLILFLGLFSFYSFFYFFCFVFIFISLFVIPSSFTLVFNYSTIYAKAHFSLPFSFLNCILTLYLSLSFLSPSYSFLKWSSLFPLYLLLVIILTLTTDHLVLYLRFLLIIC